MAITKATTNVLDLNSDTKINGITAGKGSGNLSQNTTFGVNALDVNTTGYNNTAIGYYALNKNTTGTANSASGSLALASNTTGFGNTAIGFASQYLQSVNGTNTSVGYASLYNNKASSNTAIGYEAAFNNINGSNNVAIGMKTLYSNIDGILNVAVGGNALLANESNRNTGVGYQSIEANTTGVNNTAIGIQSLYSNISGNNNTAVGAESLKTNTVFTNCAGLGYNAQVSGSNQIRIGDTNVTSITCQTNAWSDQRDKADIKDTILGLEFIKELRPVDFKWDYREDYREEPPIQPNQDASEEEKEQYKEAKEKWIEDVKLCNITHDGTHKRNRFHHGLIAQEIKSVIEKTGIDFGGFQDHTINGGDEVMTVGYLELIAPLIKAVQELSAKVEALESK